VSKHKRKVAVKNDGCGKNDWKREIKESQNYICPVCGKVGTNSSMDIHHMRPKCKNGSNSKENCVAWHKTCHRDYHQKYGTKISDRFGNPI